MAAAFQAAVHKLQLPDINHEISSEEIRNALQVLVQAYSPGSGRSERGQEVLQSLLQQLDASAQALWGALDVSERMLQAPCAGVDCMRSRKNRTGPSDDRMSL
jgi:hypothetical protein